MKSRIYQTTWQLDGMRLGALRREVFVVEQNVPEELEWDEFDATAIHFACEDISSGGIIGTARLVKDSKANRAIIGRLCVAKPFRGQRLATRIMHEILAYCKLQRFMTIELHAQLYLENFYASLGFAAHGSVYLEAGIKHITMVQQLSNIACH
jgi:predicted GNAT family N-acyltransferase